jgi:hypothetical protein
LPLTYGGGKERIMHEAEPQSVSDLAASSPSTLFDEIDALSIDESEETVSQLHEMIGRARDYERIAHAVRNAAEQRMIAYVKAFGPQNVRVGPEEHDVMSYKVGFRNEKKVADVRDCFGTLLETHGPDGVAQALSSSAFKVGQLRSLLDDADYDRIVQVVKKDTLSKPKDDAELVIIDGRFLKRRKAKS